jgi:uncharacterized repeat protein (TIGR01451 family)
VVVTDTPDANLAVVSVAPSQGTCATGVPIRCELGALAGGASARVVVTARAVAAGPVRNGATVISPNPPTDPGSEVAVAGVTAQSPPGVLLRKRADHRVVRSGGQVTFSLTATARGRRGTARDITICDRLPRGFTVVSRGGAQPRSGRWCWRISALRAGSSRTVRIVTRARSVSRVTRVTNVATLAFGDQPPRFARARVVIVPPNSRLTG